MTLNRTIILRLLPVLLVFAAYANTLNHGFVLDDHLLIVRNPHVRSMEEIPSYYLSSKTQAVKDMSIYRPLRQTLYAVEYFAFGLDPRGYHIVSVLLHSGNVLLLSVLLGILSLSAGHVFIGALLFAIHPLATESVANITGQTDLLFLFFYLGGLICAIRADSGNNRTAWTALSLAAYCCSLLSKEMAISFLLLLAALDLYRYRGDIGSYRSRIPLYAAGIVLTGIYLVARSLAIESGWTWEYYGDSFWITMFSQTWVIITYLRLFFAPYPQSARYDVALLETPFNVYTAAVVLLALGLVFATIRSIRREGPSVALFGLWWFVITLLPVSHLRPIPVSMMGERFLYLPIIGLIIFVITVDVPEKLSATTTKVLRIACVFLLVVLFSLTVARNRVWKDDLTLAEDTRDKAPDSLLIRSILFEEYRKRNEISKAAAEYQEILRINRKAALEHLRRAFVYREEGRHADAERMARKALRTKPDLAEAQEFLRTLGTGTIN